MGSPTVICVVGPPRSGTSLTARALNLLGVHLGPEDELESATEANPTGYWENRRIGALSNEVLGALGGSRLDPPAAAAGWERSEALARARRKAREIVAETFGERRIWGWKDASNSLTLPFWQEVMPEMRYAICLRNPLDTAASVARRRRLDPARALALWPVYMANTLALTAGRDRIFVPYESWFAEPVRTIERLASLAGREGAAGGSASREIERLLDSRLRHHRGDDARALGDDRLSARGASIYLTTKLLATGSAAAELGGPAAELHARLRT